MGKTFMNNWSTAYDLAKQYFKNKFDKGGEDYIEHPYRVSSTICDKLTSDENNTTDERELYKKAEIVALLHDIIEDTDCTLDILHEHGFDEDIINAVDAISRKEDEKYYATFIKRVSENQIATIVKIYDLEDNMDVKRLPKFDAYEQKRLRKYFYSWKFLKGEIEWDDYRKRIYEYK
jgi:(p)ppGpp synthase/HD superfamily hydrolase